jgi:deoxycytidine triphosphate deaminase
MGILTKYQIKEYLERGELIINAHRKEDGSFDVEPASYDLRAGILIWKEYNFQTKLFHTCSKKFDPQKSLNEQTQTIQPGQVMFVITYEELKMPKNLCGTVYAKNQFSRDGILAWTTGHIDPGINCPIVVRLINFRSIPYTIRLGEPVYTVVFHELSNIEEGLLEIHKPITMDDTISKTLKAADSILGNALNDISLTQDFINKDEFASLFAKQFFKTAWGWIIIILGIIATIMSIVK